MASNRSYLPYPMHSMCDMALNKAHEYCSSQYASCKVRGRKGALRCPIVDQMRLLLLLLLTCSSLMATQELDGKPCSIGTRNCRQPLQWPMRSIMQIRLKIRMNTEAMLRNCNELWRERGPHTQQVERGRETGTNS